MRLTPQAYRLVAEAMKSASYAERSSWESWLATGFSPDRDMPFDVVSEVRGALSRIERTILQKLHDERPDDDREADLLNDLGYVRAIDVDLKREMETGWVRKSA